MVMPLPKSGKKPDTIANLRPISFTSTACKLLEQMCLARGAELPSEKEDCFHLCQIGFCPNFDLCNYSFFLPESTTSTSRCGRKVPGILVTVDKMDVQHSLQRGGTGSF